MKGNVDTVYCELKYSGVAAGLLVAAGSCTLILVAWTPLDTALRLAATLWVVAMTGRACQTLREVRALRLDGARAIEVTHASGARRTGTVRDGSFVAPWLTLVRWRPDGAWRDRTVVVLPGMAGSDELRRLRVLLRWA
jgi:hypothetical protein